MVFSILPKIEQNSLFWVSKGTTTYKHPYLHHSCTISGVFFVAGRWENDTEYGGDVKSLRMFVRSSAFSKYDQESEFCSFFGRIEKAKNCFWDLLTFIRMFLFTIYCKKHLHLLQYYKNCQNTWDFINYLTPLCFTWPVWYDTILPSGSSELYSFFHFFLQQKILILIILKWNLFPEVWNICQSLKPNELGLCNFDQLIVLRS